MPQTHMDFTITMPSSAHPFAVIDRPHRTATKRSGTYREAREHARQLSDAELSGTINALKHERAAADELDGASAEVARLLCDDRLQGCVDEWLQREARFQAHAGPNPRAPFSMAWRDLAETVKVNVDIVDLFESNGWALLKQGREYGGSCLVCGGSDRLRVFPEPDDRHPYPRAWCRRCGLYSDAIQVLRNLRPGLGFYDAVAELATRLGLPTPTLTERVETGGSRG